MQFDEYRSIQTQIFAYGEALRDFVDEFGLPEEWFMEPDHVAYKCRNADHFDEIARQANDDAAELTIVEMDNRNIASVLLEDSVYVESFGSVEWLEIMQPRLEKQGEDLVGIEHLEFYWTDFESAEEVLRDRGISFAIQHNRSSQWISVIINEYGHEFKLCNRKLAEIIQAEVDSNEAEGLA